MNDKEKTTNLPAVMGERLVNGLFKENPTFVLLLGMCPTLAVTTSAINGLGMGLTTMVVLALSNLIISALRKIIPDKIRIPAFIVIIASFVTMVELLLEAYLPSLYDALGIYIPLIVVNCIILGRAEAYAYSHSVVASLFDGIGMGLGFTMALTIIGALRELLGAGAVFGIHVMPEAYVPVNIFVMAPGAFFVLALLTAIQNKIKETGTRRGKDMSKIQSGCGGNCLECPSDCKKDMGADTKAVKAEETKAEEPKAEEPVTGEPKGEESKPEEPQTKEVQTEEVKAEEVKAGEQVTSEEKNKDKKKSFGSIFKRKEKTSKENASEEKNSEESKTEEAGPDTGSEKPEESESRQKRQESAEPEDTGNEVTSEDVSEEKEVIIIDNEDGDGFEVIDLDDYMKIASQKQKTGKKPARKKGNTAKAMAMLSKAEETIKEDGSND